MNLFKKIRYIIISVMITLVIIGCDLFNTTESTKSKYSTININVPSSRGIIDDISSYQLTVSGSDFEDVVETFTDDTLSIDILVGTERTFTLLIFGEDETVALFKGEKTIDLESGVDVDLELEANQSVRYVSYDANIDDADTITGEVPENIYYADGEDVTISVPGNTGALINGDYALIGWNTKADGSGTTYFEDDEITLSDSDITLYAVWKDYVIKEGMVEIEGGVYTQTDNSNITFEHTLSSYSIGQYELEYAKWYEVYQWAIDNDYKFASTAKGQAGSAGIAGADPVEGSNKPVTNIHWMDIVVWCNAYSEMEGLTPVYSGDDELTLKTSVDTVQTVLVNWSVNGFRLPTEGEWQYAASGRGITPYNNVSGALDSTTEEINRVSWTNLSNENSSQDVGTKDPNSSGIYDMSGNVWEYCYDYYDVNDTEAKTDYRGAESGSKRTIRGGSCNYSAPETTVGGRYTSESGYYNHHSTVGFRLAQSIVAD